MHEPHSSGVRRITHFVRVEVVMYEKWVTKLGNSNAKLFTKVFILALVAKAVLDWSAVVQLECKSR